MHGRITIAMALLAVASVVVAASAARAEDDPPGVARVSIVEGPASYQLRESEEWTGVAVNAPLVTGDRLYSGEGARAEIQLAPGTYARLGAETQIDLIELAADATQVSVPFGRAIVRLRDDPAARHVELDTPTAAITLRRAGSYRVDVEAGGRTTIRVARGEAVVHAGGNRFELYAHSRAVVEAVGNALSYRPIALGSDDALDLWDRERDARIDAAESYRYVSTDIYGAEDLDDYGTWEYERGYGQVWRPTVVEAGWAPYRDGRWVWVDPWGWTWLDYAAWGWAPFHYGRWVRLRGAWYWAPGTVVARPVYAPALVGFYGSGAGVSVSVSVGVGAGWVGWVPLGWGEPCYPWWGGFGGARVGYAWWGGWGGPRIVNNVYVKQKNVYHLRGRDVRHVNRDHPGGFTKVGRDRFGRGGRMVPVRDGERRGFRAVGGRIDVTPDRASRRAVRPSREIVARGGRPGDGSGRGGRSREDVVRVGRSGESLARGGRPGGDVVRGGGRTPLGGTEAGRAAPTRETRAPSVRRRTADGAADLTRSSSRRTAAPRSPARAERAPSAPRQFARRSEPYVATRPSFRPASTDARSPGRSALGSRRETDGAERRGAPSASRARGGPDRTALGRGPADGGAASRRSIAGRTSDARESSDVGRRRGSGAAQAGRSGVGRRSSPEGSPAREIGPSSRRGRLQTGVVRRSAPSAASSTGSRSSAWGSSGRSSGRTSPAASVSRGSSGGISSSSRSSARVAGTVSRAPTRPVVRSSGSSSARSVSRGSGGGASRAAVGGSRSSGSRRSFVGASRSSGGSRSVASRSSGGGRSVGSGRSYGSARRFGSRGGSAGSGGARSRAGGRVGVRGR